MPKVKTRKTAAKRFKITAKGSLLRRRAYRTHKLIAKGGARKRMYAKDHVVDTTNVKAIKKMLGAK